MYIYRQDSANVFYVNETMGDLNLFASGRHLCLWTWTKVNDAIVILADNSSMKCLINVTSSAAFDKLSIYGTTGSDTLQITTLEIKPLLLCTETVETILCTCMGLEIRSHLL